MLNFIRLSARTLPSFTDNVVIGGCSLLKIQIVLSVATSYMDNPTLHADLPALTELKTWNGINWLTLDKLMANTVYMMCSFSPSSDWPKEFQSTAQLTHVKSF